MRKFLAGALIAISSLGIIAPITQASACTGDVCDGLCDFMNSKAGRIVFKDGCTIR